MVVTFGAVQGTRWVGRKDAGAGVQVELLEGPEDSLHSSYKYMFQRLRDVRNGSFADFMVGCGCKYREWIYIPETLDHIFSISSPVLTEKIEELAEGLRTHFSIEEFSPVSLPAQVQK